MSTRYFYVTTDRPDLAVVGALDDSGFRGIDAVPRESAQKAVDKLAREFEAEAQLGPVEISCDAEATVLSALVGAFGLRLGRAV